MKALVWEAPRNMLSLAEPIAARDKDEIRLDPWILEAALEDGGQWVDRLIDAPGNVSKVLLRP